MCNMQEFLKEVGTRNSELGIRSSEKQSKSKNKSFHHRDTEDTEYHREKQKRINIGFTGYSGLKAKSKAGLLS